MFNLLITRWSYPTPQGFDTGPNVGPAFRSRFAATQVQRLRWESPVRFHIPRTFPRRFPSDSHPAEVSRGALGLDPPARPSPPRRRGCSISVVAGPRNHRSSGDQRGQAAFDIRTPTEIRPARTAACTSIGRAGGLGEDSCSARTCLFSGRGCSWKSGVLWQPSSGCPGVSRSLC